jgi:hypothetical protein
MEVNGERQIDFKTERLVEPAQAILSAHNRPGGAEHEFAMVEQSVPVVIAIVQRSPDGISTGILDLAFDPWRAVHGSATKQSFEPLVTNEFRGRSFVHDKSIV